MSINRERLAWAAGLFEGEGCVSGQRIAGTFYPKLSLGSTDPDVLVAFQLAIGGFGNITTKSRRGTKPHWKPAQQWQLTRFEHLQAVLAMLWPWLKSRRRARIKQVLTDYKGKK